MTLIGKSEEEKRSLKIGFTRSDRCVISMTRSFDMKMRKVLSEKGSSLIELIMVVVILLVVGGVLFTGYRWLFKGSSAIAEQELIDYGQQLGWDVVGKSCAGVDSDGDGYISCTARVRENAATSDKALECASGALLSWTDGCKLSLPVLRQN